MRGRFFASASLKHPTGGTALERFPLGRFMSEVLRCDNGAGFRPIGVWASRRSAPHESSGKFFGGFDDELGGFEAAENAAVDSQMIVVGFSPMGTGIILIMF